MTRPVERIDPMLAALREAWLRYPDLRLGQLVVNAGSVHCSGTDVYHVGDDEMRDGLELAAATRPK